MPTISDIVFSGYDFFLSFSEYVSGGPVFDSLDLKVVIQSKQIRQREKDTNNDSVITKAACPRRRRKAEKRVKERNVGEVVELVEKWRTRNAQKPQEFPIKMISLDDAAKKLGVSRKTLDDYYL